MFTGIIEEIGILKEVQMGAQSALMTIQGEVIFDDLGIGDSVAVNGVCLTAAGLSSHTFRADVMHETLNRSCLGKLHPGEFLNLERALAANGRFGGHIVSGHIDDIGKITSVRRDDNAIWYTIAADSRILRYIVEKGSIAVDGISLTVASVTNTEFRISAIPHTVKSTILSYKKAGDLVNLENDLVGKYMEKFLLSPPNKQQLGGITREFLTKSGY
jgi:riboflavin synthase